MTSGCRYLYSSWYGFTPSPRRFTVSRQRRITRSTSSLLTGTSWFVWSTGERSCSSDVSTAVRYDSGPIWIVSAPRASMVAADAQLSGAITVTRRA